MEGIAENTGKRLRVAVVHDWLNGMRGGEKCLEIISNMFCDVEIFTAFLEEDKISDCLKTYKIYPSFLNSLPFVSKFYRHLLPFYPLAAFDLSQKIKRRHNEKPFDLVISISHCLAKNVSAPVGVKHLCYCLTPMRYIWDQFDVYFKGRKVEKIAKVVAYFLRSWDQNAAKNVTSFSCISNFVKARIEDYYARESSVVYPPVVTDWVADSDSEIQNDAYLCVCALVPYKNVDKVVEAFNQNKKNLIIVGSGPELSRLKTLAATNISFRSGLSMYDLGKLYASSKALVFAAEEDFGMIPVEMQAAGKPVICLGKGGCQETVEFKVDSIRESTGVYFSNPNPKAISEAIEFFENHQTEFKKEICIRKSKEFSLEKFKVGFEEFLLDNEIELETEQQSRLFANKIFNY